MTIDEQGRPEPPTSGTESETILGVVDFLRATLEWKCSGLSDEQLARPLASSTMTLSGMLTHLAFVEDYWCSFVVGEAPMPEPWATMVWDADEDADWHLADELTGDAVRALWTQRVATSTAVVASLLSEDVDALSRLHRRGDTEVSLRWVLPHLIEEYARHCGHADLLREAVDGQVGE